MASFFKDREHPLEQIVPNDYEWTKTTQAGPTSKAFKLFFKSFYLFIFREGKGGREGEKHQCVVASQVPPIRDLALNSGMCPGWESNQPPALNPLSHTSQG